MKITIPFILLLMFHCALWGQSDSTSVKRRGGSVSATVKDTVKPIITAVDTSIAGLRDSLKTDSSMQPKRMNIVGRFFKKDYPNPRKAMIFSLIIPGAGQAYNKKWWKIPIVYGVLGGVGYWEIEKIKEYRLYKTSYKALVDDDPLTVVTDPTLILMDKVTMKANRDIARKNVEQTSLVLGIGYLLAVTDAFVDAHMYTFDVSEDLSLKICPKSGYNSGFGTSFGVGVQLGF